MSNLKATFCIEEDEILQEFRAKPHLLLRIQCRCRILLARIRRRKLAAKKKEEFANECGASLKTFAAISIQSEWRRYRAAKRSQSMRTRASSQMGDSSSQAHSFNLQSFQVQSFSTQDGGHREILVRAVKNSPQQGTCLVADPLAPGQEKSSSESVGGRGNRSTSPTVSSSGRTNLVDIIQLQPTGSIAVVDHESGGLQTLTGDESTADYFQQMIHPDSCLTKAFALASLRLSMSQRFGTRDSNRSSSQRSNGSTPIPITSPIGIINNNSTSNGSPHSSLPQQGSTSPANKRATLLEACAAIVLQCLFRKRIAVKRVQALRLAFQAAAARGGLGGSGQSGCDSPCSADEASYDPVLRTSTLSPSVDLGSGAFVERQGAGEQTPLEPNSDCHNAEDPASKEQSPTCEEIKNEDSQNTEAKPSPSRSREDNTEESTRAEDHGHSKPTKAIDGPMQSSGLGAVFDHAHNALLRLDNCPSLWSASGGRLWGMRILHAACMDLVAATASPNSNDGDGTDAAIVLPLQRGLRFTRWIDGPLHPVTPVSERTLRRRQGKAISQLIPAYRRAPGQPRKLPPLVSSSTSKSPTNKQKQNEASSADPLAAEMEG